MSFPQAQSSATVLANQDYFRLITELRSSGEIYEIDTSIRGLVIGPQSDIQTVRLFYPDPSTPSRINDTLVSVSDPFIGRIDARMDQDYPQVGTKGRLLVASDDWVPGLAGGIGPLQVTQQFYIDSDNPDYDYDIIVWHPPQLDILAYHIDPPAVPIARSERQWADEVTIIARTPLTTGKSWYFYPHYRRKYFHARVLNAANIADLAYEIYGVTFFPTLGGGFGAPVAALSQLATGVIPTALGVVPTSVVLYSEKVPDLGTPATHPIGYYDYMLVGISGTAFGYGTETAVVLDAISSDWAV